MSGCGKRFSFSLVTCTPPVELPGLRTFSKCDIYFALTNPWLVSLTVGPGRHHCTGLPDHMSMRAGHAFHQMAIWATTESREC
jgi:hypothetical protein